MRGWGWLCLLVDCVGGSSVHTQVCHTVVVTGETTGENETENPKQLDPMVSLTDCLLLCHNRSDPRFFSLYSSAPISFFFGHHVPFFFLLPNSGTQVCFGFSWGITKCKK